MAKYIKKFLALSAVTVLLVSQGVGAVALATDEAADAAGEDSTSPSYVSGLETEPGDGQVTLSWDPSTDDTAVAGYYVYSGLSSVTEDGGSYTFGSKDVGDVTSYVMSNLSNGVTYYFSLTAYDAAGNESENYSLEVDATPEESDTGDYTEPTVQDADALTGTLVEVTFSEAVVLPADGSGAFSIESSAGGALEVLDAYLSEDDESVVFVLTDEQTAGAQYILTASADIEDDAGNPVVSGTSDTAVFTGSAVGDEVADDEDGDEVVDDDVTLDDEVADAADEMSDDLTFELEEIEVVSENELLLTFSEEVLDADPDSFVIELEENASISVAVLAVSIDDEDAAEISLITEEMEAGYDYVLSIDDLVLSKDGATLEVESQTVEFTSDTLDLADLIAPEDVSDLLASVVDETTALVSWTASVNNAGDLAQYLVYKSTDGATFGMATYVSKDVTEQEMSGLTPGETYTFMVTAVDENGNESEGVMTSVTLPETGPAMLGLVGLSLLGAGVVTRRRREF